MASGIHFFDKLGVTLGKFYFQGLAQIKAVTGKISFRNYNDSADVEVQASKVTASAGQVQLGDATNIVLNIPTGLSASYSLTLPDSDGSPNQVLSTDGSGILNWVSAASNASSATTDTTSISAGSGSTVSMLTIPAGAIISQVQVIVDTPFDGAPSLSVGLQGGSSSLFAAANTIFLNEANCYISMPHELASASAENVEAYFHAGGATVGAARILLTYSVPA